jgi:hypothetical protein
MNAREYAAAFMREYPKRDGMNLERVESAVSAAAPLPPWDEMRLRLAAFRAECVKMGTLAADGSPCDRTRYIPNAATFLETRKFDAYPPAPPVHSTAQTIPPESELLKGPLSAFVRLCRVFGEAAMRNALPDEYRAAWDAMRDAQRAGTLGSLAECPLPTMCALWRKVAVEAADADARKTPEERKADAALIAAAGFRADAADRATCADVAAGFLPSRYADDPAVQARLTPKQRADIEAHRAAGWDAWHDWLQAAGF